ncbi:MAG: NADH-ubiquinone oxidoreductase-F iron-sulfur binding region domain-containing protein [Candidatus Limnocylindrales bacterium]
MTRPLQAPRLLAGPALAAGAEPFPDHQARLGPLPSWRDGALIPVLDASGLSGRGGAGFPVGRKWRAVADAAGDWPVVLVNGAEGEPLSAKDRALMATRPHLILDGALLAAEAVAAERIILYVGDAHRAARAALGRAIVERGPAAQGRFRLVAAPDRYVAGEESAAVHFIDTGDARPVTVPPRPFERGVGGRPTLVQNVETLAHVALIARYGDAWYRAAGPDAAPGTALVTTSGPGRQTMVHEIDFGETIGTVGQRLGTQAADVQAVLIGGYFGGWMAGSRAWSQPLDPLKLREQGVGFGCGVISFLDHETCGVDVAAQVMGYMAGQSAAQCGPCVFGLRAIADATLRLAGGRAQGDDLARLERWIGQLRGRGACRHPDGAVNHLASAMHVFGDEFRLHQVRRTCSRRVRAERIS